VSFTEWIFLFGGLAVIGPVIAHLLAKPRFRRLPFTMLRFLRTGQVESQSRRKLRDLLVLLLRCTIIVLIAMLFARPVWHTRHNPKGTRSVYYLGMDNSMSMAYSAGGRSYFDEMLDSAVDYVRGAEADGLFDICALASGNWMRGLSKEQAMAAVKALRIEPGAAHIGDFVSGVSRTSRLEHSNDKVSVLVLSDFTPHVLNQLARSAETVTVDKMDVRPIVSSESIDNAAITSAHVTGPAEGKLSVNVTVANYGPIEQKRKLSVGEYARPTGRTGLRLPGRPGSSSPPLDVMLPPNQRRTCQLQLDVHGAPDEQRFLPLELALSEGDGLKADDTFYLGVSIPGHRDVNVLLAGSDAKEMFLLKTAMDALSRTSPDEVLRIRQVLIGEMAASDLAGVDVLVCSTITGRLGNLASDIREFVRNGGRLVFFVTEVVASDAVKQLWQQEVLPALPGRCVRERMHIQPKPCDAGAFEVDRVAARSLSNYRIDKILLKGYLECEPHSQARLLWQLQNGVGFVYRKSLGAGAAILVNTSVDDSLGLLTKSNASVAFCRYLLGQANRISEYSFARDEQIVLPVPERWLQSAGQQQLWVETCDGKKHRAAIDNSFLRAPEPGGIGWVRTMSRPTLWAGVNLPQGETDMTKPDPAELADIMGRVFPAVRERQIASAEALGQKQRRPLWRAFAWMLIVLLLIEPAVANRLRR
jgi:hypothetical protein